MSDRDFDTALARLFQANAPAPSEDAVRRVLASPRTERSRRWAWSLAAAALCAAVVAAVVPIARGTLADGLGALSDFIHSDGPAPGPSIADVSHPGWVNDLPEVPGNAPAPPNAHVVATAPNGQRLLAYREPDNSVCFLYGSFGGECRQATDPMWKDLLTSKPIGLLARSRDREGLVAVWGLVGSDVVRVRVHYANGSSRTFRANQGFVAIGPAQRVPRTVDALNAKGAVLATADAQDPRLTQCDPSTCGVAAYER